MDRGCHHLISCAPTPVFLPRLFSSINWQNTANGSQKLPPEVYRDLAEIWPDYLANHNFQTRDRLFGRKKYTEIEKFLLSEQRGVICV